MTRVKICGLSTAETMEAAVEHGADYVGLVFFSRSPRNVDAASAAKLATLARGRAKIVALTVDADDLEIAGIVDRVQPDMLQLHGHETPARVAEIAKQFSLPTIKAIAVATAADAIAARDYRNACDIILFDAKPPPDAALPGGNGLAFDWTSLEPIYGEFDYMLSGGLNGTNVRDAIRLLQPFAVDVSSGVETRPGVKDVALIRRFLQAVKIANH